MFIIFLILITTVCGRNFRNVEFNELPEEKLLDAVCRSFHKKQEAPFLSCYFDVCTWKNESRLALKELKLATEPALSLPQLICKEDDSANFFWKDEGDFAFFLQASGDFTPATTCNHIAIKNLRKGSNQIRLWAVSFVKKEILYSDFTNLTMAVSKTAPPPVTHIAVQNISCGQNFCDATIEWNPNEDYSCFYDLIWLKDGTIVEDRVNVVSGLHQASLKGLTFGTNYSVDIMARNGDPMYESAKKTLHFQTPTCLEVFQSLDKCPPDVPQDFVVNETLIDGSPNYNVHLHWENPDLKPAYYMADFTNLDHNATGKFLNISGNLTHAVFENMSLGDLYHVSLMACSSAGCSKKVATERHRTDFVTIDVSSPHQWGVLTLVLVPLIALLGGAFLINYYRMKQKRKEQRDRYFTELDEEKLPDSVEKIEFATIKSAPDQWELNSDKLCFQSVLGEGAFGVVRRAFLEMKDGSKIQVAVKMLKDCPNGDEIRQFTQEINIMKSVKQHPYIVSLVGCITEGRIEGPLLVVEYCSRGDLQTYLRNAWEKFCSIQQELNDENYYYNQKNYFANKTYDIHHLNFQDEFIIEPKHLLSVARQVALGMEHLAKTRVVHRDLAARNVLVCENHTVKVSDFGLSRDVYRDNVYCKSGAGKLPIRWMALESLTHQIYTTYSDVWSFGVLLWEIVTLGSTPYVGLHTSDLLEFLKSGNRLSRPSNCSPQLYAIMQSCWKASPKNRPTFTELCKNLDDLLENISHYLQIENVDPNLQKTAKKLHQSLSSNERYIKPVTFK